jgi:ABC-type multidrug transport system fused ATPase/permease subunit
VYTWAGIAYLLGIYLIFIMIGAWAIAKKRREVTIGTKRRLDLEDAEEEAAIQHANNLHTGGQSNNKAQGSKQMQTGVVSSTDVAVTVVGHDDAASALPFQPMSVIWRHLSYTVTLPNGKEKRLLTDISGFCRPGEMTALMGASGAGKTTLMDVICGRKTAGKIEGEILVNGKPKDDAAFRKVAGYVEQTDLHMPFYTVHESLLFSATLRLPSTVTKEQRLAFVTEIEELLELSSIKDRIIGNENVGGLAPGQLKVSMETPQCQYQYVTTGRVEQSRAENRSTLSVSLMKVLSPFLLTT